MDNVKLYMVVEDYFYNNPCYDRDVIAHIITHNKDKALEVYKEFVKEQKDFFKEEAKVYNIEITEENDNILFLYTDTKEYKQIIEEYKLNSKYDRYYREVFNNGN